MFPQEVNTVVFILFKPVANGIVEKTLEHMDEKNEKFFSLVIKKKHPYRIGFDTCFTLAILWWVNTVPKACIDACEALIFRYI